MSLDFVPPKNPLHQIDLDRPLVTFECNHQSTDPTLVHEIHHKVRIGLGLGLCAACDEKKTQEDKVLRSVASSIDEGLRPIEGSREQVATAEKIRADVFQFLKKQYPIIEDKIFTEEERADAHEVLDSVRAEASEQTDASWWNNAKHKDKPGLMLLNLCEETRLRLRDLEDKQSERFEQTSCGHANDLYPFGPLQKKLCASCQMETKQRLQNPANKVFNIAKKTEENREAPSIREQLKGGFPVLEGTEKQIAWAEKIRDKFLAFAIETERQNQQELVVRQTCQQALQQTKAKWWIELADRENPQAVYQHLKAAVKTGAAIPRADGLPELTGSEKQITWAEQIRRDFFAELHRQEQQETNPKRKQALATIRQNFMQDTFAGEWIVRQNTDIVRYINESCDYYTRDPG